MTLARNDPPLWRQRFECDRDAEEALLDRFRHPDDPLKILIVTARLLTGFDAPILQTMYPDKPLRDHTLLQAICRTMTRDRREREVRCDPVGESRLTAHLNTAHHRQAAVHVRQVAGETKDSARAM